MLTDPNHKQTMPDIAQSQKASFQSPLEWVGMEKVVLPLTLDSGLLSPAEADIFVNVADKSAKGIHMSRLYLSIHEHLEEKKLSSSLLKKNLKNFVDSQKGLSDSAKIILRWNELHQRKALLSEFSGWKNYPLEVTAQLVRGVYSIDLKFSVFYSSTCPCSAALARQLYQQAFAKEFSPENINFDKIFSWLGESQIAAPHSQRSRADITLKLKDDNDSLSAITYIDRIEAGLKTPVQTAVKREDEQEFARLNGENTVFVEDALRVMHNSLNDCSGVESFKIKTHHYESLHAHDAVGSIVSE